MTFRPTWRPPRSLTLHELAIVGPKFIGGPFGVGEGMGIRKADADLTAKFDKALAEAIADGTVKKLSEKWFKIDMTPQS